MAKQLDLFTFAVGEYLFFGLILFLPRLLDTLMNPKDGYLKFISGIGATELESNHLDPMFLIISQLKGAGILSLVAMIPMIRDEMSQSHVLRTGLYLHFLLLLLYGRAAIVQDNPYLNLPMIGFYAGTFFVYTLWFLAKVINHAGKDTMKRTPASRPRLFGMLAYVLLMGPTVLLDYVYPHHVDPGKLFSFWIKTTLPNNTKDELSVFQSQASGAVRLAFVISALEVFVMDRSVERIEWCNQCAVVSNVLYLTVFVRAALDDTGYAYKPAWIIVSVIMTIFLLFQVADLFGWWSDTLKHTATELEVPKQHESDTNKKLK